MTGYDSRYGIFSKEAAMRIFGMNTLAITLLGAALLLAFSPQAADAAIKCKGNFQVTKYGLIATPWCQEEQIARVAQSYGWKGTAKAVRNDPLTKVKLCYQYGGDTRLKGSCGAYSPHQYF
jgi:hypothetical protein